jgi:hypothetical protein
VKLKFKTPKAKGKGEAYQSWNKDQISAVANKIRAAAPPGARAPVSVVRTRLSAEP